MTRHWHNRWPFDWQDKVVVALIAVAIACMAIGLVLKAVQG